MIVYSFKFGTTSFLTKPIVCIDFQEVNDFGGSDLRSFLGSLGYSIRLWAPVSTIQSL